MRIFKVNDHRANYTYAYPEIGTIVCSIAGMKTIGAITHIGNVVDHSQRDVQHITVLWLTGTKKGRTEIKNIREVCNVDSLRASVDSYLQEIDKTISNAKECSEYKTSELCNG